MQTLLYTTDGGRSWASVSAPVFLRGVSQGIAATGPRALVLGGAGLVRTVDAGRSWARLSEHDISATDGTWVVGRSDSAALVGRDAGRRVLLFDSHDQGASFQREAIGDSSDPNTVGLGGDGRVWRIDLSRRLSRRE